MPVLVEAIGAAPSNATVLVAGTEPRTSFWMETAGIFYQITKVRRRIRRQTLAADRQEQPAYRAAPPDLLRTGKAKRARTCRPAESASRPTKDKRRHDSVRGPGNVCPKRLKPARGVMPMAIVGSTFPRACWGILRAVFDF
jgi:hypothetical protein